MGFYISVESDVKVYIEDINPTGKKRFSSCTVGRETITFLNTSIIICPKWDTDVSEWITEGLAIQTDPGQGMTMTACQMIFVVLSIRCDYETSRFWAIRRAGLFASDTWQGTGIRCV